jgi:putative flippase GtrA
MVKKVKNLVKKYKEIITYVIVGGMTTLVNWAVYFSLFKLVGLDDDLANVISIVVAVTFAFFANKFFVFRSKTTTAIAFFREMLLFGASRFVSALFEVFGYMFLKYLLSFIDISFVQEHQEIASKILISVVIIVLNYVLSKFIVFRKKKK